MSKWILVKEEEHKWYIIQYFIELKTKRKLVKTIRYVCGVGLIVNVFRKIKDVRNFDSCLWDMDDKAWIMSVSDRIIEFLKNKKK